jgi:hypothetical protein
MVEVEDGKLINTASYSIYLIEALLIIVWSAMVTLNLGFKCIFDLGRWTRKTEKISLAGPAGFRTPSDDARAETFFHYHRTHSESCKDNQISEANHQKPYWCVKSLQKKNKKQPYASTTAPALSAKSITLIPLCYMKDLLNANRLCERCGHGGFGHEI